MTFKEKYDWKYRQLIANVPVHYRHFVKKWWDDLCLQAGDDDGN